MASAASSFEMAVDYHDQLGSGSGRGSALVGQKLAGPIGAAARNRKYYVKLIS